MDIIYLLLFNKNDLVFWLDIHHFSVYMDMCTNIYWDVIVCLIWIFPGEITIGIAWDHYIQWEIIGFGQGNIVYDWKQGKCQEFNMINPMSSRVLLLGVDITTQND